MTYDVAVIGGGPGGYVAAIKAAQNGLTAVLFEKEKLGGVCLNRGCIPTKALLKSASVYHTAKSAAMFGVSTQGASFDWAAVMARKEKVVGQLVGGIGTLVGANSIEFVSAEATVKDAHTVTAGGSEYAVKNIILATGSQPSLPPIEGIREAGVLTSDELLSIGELPKSLAVVGGGVIGLEFAFMLSRFGVKVTIIELLPNIIAMVDAAIIGAVTKDIKKAGIVLATGARVKRIEKGVVVYEKDGRETRVEADAVLVAAGRKPASDTAMLDRLGIAHKNGMIQTDGGMRTNVPGIYAIGDVNGKSMLAHTASEEGIVAVENICGHAAVMDYRQIPQCVYLEPEIAWAGMTDRQAREAGHDVITGVFPMTANGKSLIEAETSGFVKFVADRKYGEILGTHMYCAHATDMIAEVVLAMKTECCMEDIAKCIHAHPTVSEAVMEAANATTGMAIHSLKQ